MKTVSVIIPVYNRSQTLPRLFNSLRGITYRPVQLVFVDNNSTDNSLELCKAFCQQLRLNIPDGSLFGVVECCLRPGASAARNQGLKIATGEYCCFFDSDDEFSPDFLSAMMAAIGNSDLCLTRTRMVMPDGTTQIRAGWASPSIADHLLVQMVSTQSFLARTDYVRSVGGWDETLRIWDDYELGLRLLSGQYRLAVPSSSFYCSPPRLSWQPDVWHRIYQHSDSLTGATFSENYDRICHALSILLHETYALCDRRATKALLYRTAILRGHFRQEGNAKLAYALPIKMRDFFSILLEKYVSLGGRGAWRVALKFLKI